MAKVGQVGKFSIYVFAPSKHDNKYVKIKGKGGEVLGKFRIDIWKWETEIDMTTSDKKKITEWIENNLKKIENQINKLSRL